MSDGTIDPYGNKTEETKKVGYRPGSENVSNVIISSLYSRVDGRQCAENPSVNATLLNIFEMTKLEGIENVVVWAWHKKRKSIAMGI